MNDYVYPLLGQKENKAIEQWVVDNFREIVDYHLKAIRFRQLIANRILTVIACTNAMLVVAAFAIVWRLMK